MLLTWLAYQADTSPGSITLITYLSGCLSSTLVALHAALIGWFATQPKLLSITLARIWEKLSFSCFVTLVWLVCRRINHILQSTVYELSGESKSQWKANKSINYLATSYSSSTVYLHTFWTRTNNPNMCNTTSRQIPSGYLFTRRKRTNTHNTRVYRW